MNIGCIAPNLHIVVGDPFQSSGQYCTGREQNLMRAIYSSTLAAVDPLMEGFEHFVSSMCAPVASEWSGLPGEAFSHWKTLP